MHRMATTTAFDTWNIKNNRDFCMRNFHYFYLAGASDQFVEIRWNVIVKLHVTGKHTVLYQNRNITNIIIDQVSLQL